MMNTFKTIDEVLDFAMEGEQNAVDLYTALANQTDNTEMRDTFIQFAREEMGHKARLLEIKTEGTAGYEPASVTDLKISDYLSVVQPAANMDYRQALILAMSNEKAAFRLYTRLAADCNQPELKNVFLGLAQEEAKHKLRFEIEYDDYVLREN
jgi:rubrerythrin